MPAVNMFANTSESYQQDVEAEKQQIREYNAPTFNVLRTKLRKSKHGEKGLKIVYDNLTQGGHSTPTAMRPDWNEPTVNEEIASYVYPVRYRLPMLIDHALLRDFNNGINSAANSIRRQIKNGMTVALKRLNYAAHGTGDGALAYATTTTTLLGSQTMNCDIIPAVSSGHTNGAKHLRKNNVYQAINTATNLPRGLFIVTAEGSTSCTINVLSGTVSSGDPIVDVNTYNGFFRGLPWLISKANRTIQNINTADFPDFNSYGIDLANAPLTFSAMEDLWAGLNIRNNDGGKNGKVVFMPIGQASALRKTAQNLRVYNDGSNVVRGIAEDIDFGTNISVIMDADADLDRVYVAQLAEFGCLEEMPLDEMSMDGQKLHQLMGANNTGSERYQHGIGWDGNFFRRGNAQGSAYLFRASVTGILGQSNI